MSYKIKSFGLVLSFLVLSCGQPSDSAAQRLLTDSIQLKHAVKSQILKLNDTGKKHNAAGNKELALDHHEKALQLAKKHGLYEEQARSLIGIADVLKAENADQSIIHLKNALALSNKIGHDQLSAEIYSSLSAIYRQQSRYELALRALEEHHKLTDSLLNADKASKITLLHKTYQRNISLAAVAAIACILLLLMFYFYKTSKLNKNLKASNKIKDKLFTIIGHDLRTPIGSITDVLAMMEHDELTPDEQRHMIAQMRKQGDTSLEILNGLLNWGTAQLNGIKVSAKVFRPKDYISKNIIALHGKSSEKEITITDQTAPNLELNADPDHFDFIIRNLISNAIKFSHPGGKIIVMSNTHSKTGQVVFSVTDYGRGISVSQQQRFKSENLDVAYGTKGEKGTGIGLMLSKEFIKANQGQLWVESEEGKGATFYFNMRKV